jgi:ABC-type transport system involved in multi-copper enzyme maturation permease subunit
MYFWKCWRDTRRYFFVCLILTIAVTLLWFIGLSPELRSAPTNATAAEALWFLVVSGALTLGFPFAVLVGLGLGSKGVGQGLGSGIGDFLLTRPRSRKYFIWASWTVGMGEIFLLLTATTLVTLVAMYYEGGLAWRHFPSGPVTAGGGAEDISKMLAVVDIPLLLVSVALTATMVYGLTYFIGVLTRSAGRALTYSIALLLAYAVLGNILSHWTHYVIPSVSIISFNKIDQQAFHAWYLTPKLQIIVRMICTLGFPALAQLVLDRSDI